MTPIGRIMGWFGRSAVALGVAAAVLSAAVPASSMEIPTALGSVAIPAAPRRIAVYDVPAVDTLARLGVKLDGLPSRLYVPELEPLSRTATPVGTIHEPDLEALSALAPDLTIVGGRSSTKLASVRQVGPAVDMSLDGANLLPNLRSQLAAYGRLFGREAEAQAASAELDAAVAATRAAAQGRGNALIVMTNGPRLSAYGPGSRFGWLHTDLGLPPAVPNLQAAIHGEVISFEFIRKADPDWLIVLDRTTAIGEAGGNARATLDNELVAQTTAGRRGQILLLPPADFYIAAGGFSATLRVLARIRDGFQAAR